MLRLPVLSALIALTVAVGCGQQPIDGQPGQKVYPNPEASEPVSVISVDEENAYSIDGVAFDAAADELHVLKAGVGIVIYGDDGEEHRRIPFVEGSPWDVDAEPAFYDIGYRDIDLLPDGAYVLAGPIDSHYFDPEEGAPASYFCLVPGFEEIVMVNNALAVDPVTDLILAAPTYYDSGISMEDPSEAYLVSYFMDGTQQASNDVLGSGVVATGLARDAHSNDVFAVEGNELSVFSLEGQYKRSYTLEGVQAATGVALDANADLVWVTDGADRELRSFDASLFRD